MATRNLGQAAIVSKGAYSSGQSYILLNTVTHRGGSFMCVASCQGVEPGVSSNWQNYWVATAKGIRQIAITSATAGTATVTVTFSDNTTYSNTYSTTAIPDGAVTTNKMANGAVTSGKIASGAVITDKIAANAVTREKLAEDALYSPVKSVTTASYDLLAEDFGKTLRFTSSSNVTVNVSAEMFDSVPTGFEVALVKWVSNDTSKITITVEAPRYLVKMGMPFASGAGGTVSTLSDRYAMVALKKMTSESMLATGALE